MTKKRFTINDGQNLERISKGEFVVRPFKDYDKPLNLREVLKLLNELDEKYVDEYALRETLQLELQRVGEENQELKEENEYLCEKIKENEWHWNTIDEDRDVWRYKCKTLEEENKQLRIEKDTAQKQHSYELDKKLQYKSKLIDLKKENEQLRKDIKEKEEVIKFYHRFNRGVDDDL